MEIRKVGGAALLLEVDAPLAWFAALQAARAAGDLVATDIVPGARTVLVDGIPDQDGLADLLRRWPEPKGYAVRAARQLTLPVTFDGPDLPVVAEHWGVGVGEVIARLVATTFAVAFSGFAPGFAYLTGLAWTVPRLPSPRVRVPAGSLGLAGEFAGIYPTASPGGWQLVGRSGAQLFDVARDPPALLTPGTTVRLESE